MKRVLCLMSSMNAGGAETFMMKLYRTIDRTKYQMDFCVNVYEKNFYEDEILGLGGKVYRIPSRSADFTEHNKQLKQIIEKENYKYLMAVSSSSTCFFDMKIGKKMGVIRTIVRSSNSANGTSVMSKIMHKFFQIKYQKYVDVMFAPSKLAASYLFGDKNDYIPLHNAINYDIYAFNDKERKRVRALYGLDEKTIVIGHVGRFNTQKNHSRLIDIFKAYHTKHPNSKLLLIGIGDLQESIKEKVEYLGLKNNVVFAGLQNNVAAYFSAMDVCLFPSFYEGMPNVIIEAQASGLSCVISDTITKEANITGNVLYESLSSSNELWVNKIEEVLLQERIDTRLTFKEKGYFIEDVVKVFVDAVFK